MSDEVPTTNAETEHRFHDYATNRIPWFARLIWLGFWVFAVYYTIRYLFPDIQFEFAKRQ